MSEYGEYGTLESINGEARGDGKRTRRAACSGTTSCGRRCQQTEEKKMPKQTTSKRPAPQRSNGGFHLNRRLEKALLLLCAQLGYSLDQLKGPRGKHEQAWARAVAMFMCHRQLGVP